MIKLKGAKMQISKLSHSVTSVAEPIETSKPPRL